MKAIVSIAVKTIRSAIRKKIAHLLLLFAALTTFVLPLTVKSDGTAKGLVQISVTYTLGITGILLSLTAVWLGATLMSEDIEGYQIHMVVTKPVSRFQLMLGKWLGVVTLLGGILAVSAAGIYVMCMYRLHRSGFSEGEMAALEREVLTGRHVYDAPPMDVEKFAENLLRERLDQGAEIPKNMPKDVILDSMKTQITKATESVGYGQFRPWIFTGLPTDLGEQTISLRYRVFVERSKKKDQRQTQGVWMFRAPDAEESKSPFIGVPTILQGGIFAEMPIPASLISPEGELEVRYVNWDRWQKTVVFEDGDGPTLMVGQVSFLNNYSRVVFLLLLQVMFMATLGCVAGACLSTPMAVFISFSYVFIGLLVRYSVIANEGMTKPQGTSVIILISEFVRQIVSAATFSLNEYVRIGVLTDGRLVEGTALGTAMAAMLFARAVPIFVIGLICFHRRELGLVVRK